MQRSKHILRPYKREFQQSSFRTGNATLIYSRFSYESNVHPDHITCLFWSKKSYLLQTLCHSLLVLTTWIWPFDLHVLEFRNLIFHARRCLNLGSTYPKPCHTAKHDKTRWKKSTPVARSAIPKACMFTYVNILVLRYTHMTDYSHSETLTAS